MSARPLAFAALFTAPLLAAVLLLAPGRGADAGGGATIDVVSFSYCGPGGSGCANPYEVTVDPGSTVTWRWGANGGGTSIAHTVTECTNAAFSSCPGTNFNDGPQTSGTLDFGVDSGGLTTYYFRCNVHPFDMRGVIHVGGAATPTASPAVSLTPSPSASPTAPATATPAATVTPSPGVSPAPGARSDVTCDGETDGDDVLTLLLHAGALAQPAGNGCPPLGSAQGDELKGDLDCDGLIGANDALLALYVWAGLPVSGLPAGCPGP